MLPYTLFSQKEEAERKAQEEAERKERESKEKAQREEEERLQRKKVHWKINYSCAPAVVSGMHTVPAHSRVKAKIRLRKHRLTWS